MSRGAVAGAGSLIRFGVRTDRRKLGWWTAGVVAFVGYVTAAIPAAYPTEEDLDAVLGLLADPVGRLMVGPGYGLREPTHETVIANGYSLWILLVVALANIFGVVRHTRAEEQSGRAELVRADVVGRRAPLTAALAIVGAVDVLVGIGAVAVLVGVGGFGVTGAVVFGASLTATGLAFAGITAVTAQLSADTRGAAGLAGAVLGVSFVVRAGGDMAREGGNALSWLSPLGWGQQTAPYVHDRLWPLALPLALAVGCTAVAFALADRRDHGASFLAVRPGRPRAAASLGTPLGLAWRLQRTSIAWWTVAVAASGVLYGVFADAMSDAELPDTIAEVFGDGDLVAGYLEFIARFNAYLLAVFAALAVQAARRDEVAGRAEPLLATPIGRARWLGAHVAVAAVAVAVISALVGVATGVGAAVVTGDSAWVLDLTWAQLNQAPAVLVVLALTVALFGAAPRAVAAGWAVVGYSVFVGVFGGLLDLPSVVLDLAPFSHPAAMPLQSFDPVPAAALTGLAAVAVVTGLVAFRRRDVLTT